MLQYSEQYQVDDSLDTYKHRAGNGKIEEIQFEAIYLEKLTLSRIVDHGKAESHK